MNFDITFLTFLLSPDSQLTIEDPVGRAVPTNGSLHLSCDSPHTTHTAWFRGQPAAGPVPVTGDPRIVTNGDDLWLTSFHASEHAGLYYCLVTTDTGDSVRSCPANVTHASELTNFLPFCCFFFYLFSFPHCSLVQAIVCLSLA